MACAKIPSPVTVQQHYESFAAAPQGFSRSADGGGVHSSGDRPAPRAGIGDIFLKPQAGYCQDRLQAQAPQRSKSSMGGTKPLNFHAGRAQ